MSSTTENTTAMPTEDNQHLCYENTTCECYKINWDFNTFIHTLKSTGEILDCDNIICCQSKVNDGYWTYNQYKERCVVMDAHEEQILQSAKSSVM